MASLRGRLLVVLALALGGGSLGACEDGTAPGPAPSSRSSASPVLQVAWREVRLPDGTSPVALAVAGDALIVGTRADSPPRARLFRLQDGRIAEIPTTPDSPYAFEATWLSIAAHGGRIAAVGGARGGAHANYRWTVWTGTVDGVIEHPQPFGVFGGWGAGDLSGIAFAGDEAVISGAWASDTTGNDVSIWRATGQRWERLSSTGTPLASTARALAGAWSLSSTGEGLALAGSLTELNPGNVLTVAALWTSPGPAGPWTLTRLPGTATLNEGQASTCTSEWCLVVGRADARLVLWEVSRGAATGIRAPAVELEDDTVLLPPLRMDGATILVTPHGMFRSTAVGWERVSAPEGLPVASAVIGGSLHVVTVGPDGARHLWVGRLEPG